MTGSGTFRGFLVLFLFLASIFFVTAGPPPVQAQDVEVSSADPNNAPQGTVNLNVIITGKRFERGAVAKWFVADTENPGGVTVNSTAFINATQLVANISVSGTASVAKFDVRVYLSGGRTGKGIELFAVTKKGTRSKCTLAPLPDAFSLVGTLNSVSNSGEPLYRGFFGEAVRARKATLGSAEVYVVAVGSNSSGKLEVFFLDPLTGAVLDGQIQPHLTLSIPPIDSKTNFHVERVAIGDVNADGVPDIAIADWLSGKAYVYVGAVQNGILTYSSAIPLAPPGNQSRFGYSLAIGDLDGSSGDEVAVGAPGGGAPVQIPFREERAVEPSKAPTGARPEVSVTDELITVGGKQYLCKKVTTKVSHPDGRTTAMTNWCHPDVPFSLRLGKDSLGGVVKRVYGRWTLELVEASQTGARAELEIPRR